MSGLRCRVGDLAVVVRGDRPEFIGHIVRITRPCPIYRGSWDTDPPKYVRGFLLPCSFADHTLRPIRPDEPATETEREKEAA